MVEEVQEDNYERKEGPAEATAGIALCSGRTSSSGRDCESDADCGCLLEGDPVVAATTRMLLLANVATATVD